MAVGPEKLYVLTSSTDMAVAFKNTTTLDYGLVIRDLMGSFGLSEEGITAIFQPTRMFLESTRQYNPHGKDFFRLKSDFYHAQLHPGPRFEATQRKLLERLEYALTYDHIPTNAILKVTDQVKHVSLYRLCQQVFVRAGTEVFFGKRFLDLSPSLLDDFINFDENNWMVFYNWPGKAKALDPMRNILGLLQIYVDIPKADRQDTSWLIQMFEEAQGHSDASKDDVAVMLMVLLWV